MNAPLEHATQATVPSESVLATSAAPREVAPARDDNVCWIEVHRASYPPDQQVELLHLQAEAEALLLQLQTIHQRRQS
ncbi:MAG: hypothetical protein WBG38_10305, partial [Nodosilinea sp.]